MQNFTDGKIPVADNKASSLMQLASKELADQFDTEELENIKHWLLEHFAGITKQQFILYPDSKVNQSSLIHFCNAIEKLKLGMPVQYVIGEVDFYGLKLKVNPDVLIPRPETEELVDTILKENDKRNVDMILDIGTGSGCIALSLAGKLKGAQITAIDISKEALNLAKENALLNNIANVEFIEIDFLKENYLEEKEFDIIVSNPPYIAESEKKALDKRVAGFEPALALFVPDDDPLIFYKAIATLAVKHLKEKGLIYVEINERLGEETMQIFSPDIFSSVILMQDMFGNNRFIKAEKK